MVQNNNPKNVSGGRIGDSCRRESSSARQQSLVNSMSPPRAPVGRAAELREYQAQTSGVSLGDLAAHGMFHGSGRPPMVEPDAARQRAPTLHELHNTIQYVLDLVDEEDLASW